MSLGSSGRIVVTRVVMPVERARWAGPRMGGMSHDCYLSART